MIVPQEVEVTKVVVATPRPTCDRVNKLYDQFQEDIVAEYESRWPVSANEEAEILNRVFGLVYAIRFLFPNCVEAALGPEEAGQCFSTVMFPAHRPCHGGLIAPLYMQSFTKDVQSMGESSLADQINTEYESMLTNQQIQDLIDKPKRD